MTQRQMLPHPYYDWTMHTSRYYIQGYVIATLDHSLDVFEAEIEMTEEDKDYYYSEMLKNMEEMTEFDEQQDNYYV